MAIVIISCVAEEVRRDLAAGLARKLGCPALSREELVERAAVEGIPVGKLEMAVLKGATPRERLARHKARYLAFITTGLCEQALKHRDLVYHGRAGNLLLPGVGHVLRVRILPDPEKRLELVMARLRLSREKALEYVRDLDRDIGGWVSFAHGVELSDLNQYDLVLNLAHMSLESASATICSMAQMPDFQPTPASRRAMEDLYLAAQARDLLGRDERTAGVDLNVSVAEGRITVTYMPGQAGAAPRISAALAGLGGARELICTMATTNILWVGENFDPDSAAYTEVTDLARRWGAAVEILRLLPGAGAAEESPVLEEGPPPDRTSYRPKAQDPTGGIEDDLPERPAEPGGGLRAASERLIHDGLFAGSQTFTGGAEQVVKIIKREPRYSMVVVGEVFASKGAAARTRLTRELTRVVGERTRVPVLTADELREKVAFGRRHYVRLAVYLAVVAAIYGLVFAFQGPILNFLGGAEWKSWRVAATLAIAAITPAVAYLYGHAMDLLLKRLRFE